MKKEEALEFDCRVTVSEERIQDLICCAMEGGIGYWATIVAYENPDGVEVEYRHNELPMTARGAVILTEDNDGPLEGQDRWRFDRAAVTRGLTLLASKHPAQWAEFMDENEDAETGDAFVQLALFGELVYG